MQWSKNWEEENGRSSQPPEDAIDLDELARALPRRLTELLAGLAYLAPPGQQLALEAIGPGSRLVLEALQLIGPHGPATLTEHGQKLSERLADSRSPRAPAIAGITRIGPRMRRVARIVPIHERGLAAASTAPADAEEAGARRAIYELLPESDDPTPSGTGATVMVARVGRNVMVWQHGGRDAVVSLESMDVLPRSGPPVVLANPDDEPPSRLLRHRLALADENPMSAENND